MVIFLHRRRLEDEADQVISIYVLAGLVDQYGRATKEA